MRDLRFDFPPKYSKNCSVVPNDAVINYNTELLNSATWCLTARALFHEQYSLFCEVLKIDLPNKVILRLQCFLIGLIL